MKGHPKNSRPKFTSRIVGVPLHFHFLAPKMYSRRLFSVTGEAKKDINFRAPSPLELLNLLQWKLKCDTPLCDTISKGSCAIRGGVSRTGPLSLRAAKRGCFKRGGFPIWTCPSFFVLFCPFGTFPGIFPICAGTVRGFSRLVLFLFLSLLRAPTRNSPERVRDTIWTIPEKSGKHPGLETPRFSFSQ